MCPIGRLAHEAAERLAALENPWISVEESPEDDRIRYLVMTKSGRCAIGYRDGDEDGGWWIVDGALDYDDDPVAYYMPIPELEEML